MKKVWNKKILTKLERDFLVSLLNNKFLTYQQIINEFNIKFPNDMFINKSGFLRYLKRENLYRGYQPTWKMFHSQEELDFVIDLMKNKKLRWRDIAFKFHEKYRQGEMKKRFPKNLQETMSKTFNERRPNDIINNGKFAFENNVVRLPIGSEVVKKSKNGKYYTWVKVADNRVNNQLTRNNVYRTNWKPKQVVIWEQAHNDKVGKNEIVIFLDGNINNFETSNLRKISRSLNGSLSGYDAHGCGIVTDAMIEVLLTEKEVKLRS